ncbi:Mitochondrial substrate/solute carrier [Sesbania bispinosa]|nr:Mitochondrial substrate/solute carrier [Sesbania bispinosa]
MGGRGIPLFDDKRDNLFSISYLGSQWGVHNQEGYYQPGGLFASVGQMGMGFGVQPPNPSSSSSDSQGNSSGMRIPCTELYVRYVQSEGKVKIVGVPDEDEEEVVEGVKKNKKRGVLKSLKIKVKNPSLRRLISGAFAGACVTHCCGTFGDYKDPFDGWKGNLVNVIRVAPSKAIELFAYDTVNKNLSPKPGEQPKLPIPPSLIAGACAGVSSTICTYPLELLKTRLTIQRGVYDGLCDAFLKIIREEGAAELYRGLAPSLIGQEKIGNIETLLIGSAAGAISSSATFPLEVARKQMQVGALSGRQVYKNVIHALASILEQEGIQGTP